MNRGSWARSVSRASWATRRVGIWLALLATFATAHSGMAEMNRYDLVARMLAPYIDLLLENPKLAHTGFDAEFEPGAIRKSSEAAASKKDEQVERVAAFAEGIRLRVVLGRPDRLRVEGQLGGQHVIVCRSGDDVWAWPASVLQPLLAQAPPKGKVYSSRSLGSWKLPVADSQAVFLPALLKVEDVAITQFEGDRCRVVDLGLMPELSSAGKLESWAARAWIREGDRKLVRVSVRGPDWQGVLNVRKMDFLETIPSSMWEPDATQQEDVVRIDPARYRQFVATLMGGR